MRHLLLAVVSFIALAGCSEYAQPIAPESLPVSTGAQLQASPNAAQTESIPLTMLVWVGCAAGGAGELVQLEGALHIVSHVTSDGVGGFHLTQHFQPQGVTGTGATTGDKYQATGVTRWHTNAKVGFTDTYVNNFRIIGQGPGNNFLVHETFHVTVNANGRVTTALDHYSVSCK